MPLENENELQFEKYFTLDEAVSLLPFVKQTFREARKDLLTMKDEVVLYERMQHIQEAGEGLEDTNSPTVKVMSDVLRNKWEAYEACFHRWLEVLTDKGIQVRDFRKGLIDFPYLAKDGTEYLLCWHWGEEGLFYFHDTDSGFPGRQPITLLPE